MRALILALVLLPSIALGEVSVWDRAAFGSAPGISQVYLNGNNGGITTTFEPLWPQSAAYTVLAVAMSSPYCASDDTNDTSAGTGARTIRVTGITSAFAAFSEDLTMNGQTSVVMANTTAQLINSVEVLTAGSGGSNAGAIRCGTGTNTAGVPAVVHAHVAIGFNRSQSAIYGVPANKTLLCRNWTLSSYKVTAGESVQFAVDRYVNNGVRLRELLGHVNQAGANAFTYPGEIKFAQKSIIVVQALSAASTGPVQAQAECLLIDAGSANANQVEF